MIPTKTCNKCGQEKPITDFHNSSRTKDGKNYYCKECENARNRQQYKGTINKKNWKLKHRFKITYQDYLDLLKIQNYKCLICGCDYTAYKEEFNREFCIDHNHETGEIRGLLCMACNRGIGLLQDNPAILRKAADYLEERGNY